MSLGQRFQGRVVLIGALVAAMFAACAQGNQSEAPPTSGGSGGTGGSGGAYTGIPPGEVGGPCSDETPCVDEGSTCTQVGNGKYCTVPCPPSCPDGTYCAIIQGDPICVPDLGSQCLPCSTPLQCLNPSDTCLTAPAGDKFCARDCTTTGECPNGFTCTEAANYPTKPAGDPPDAGAPDAGPSGDAGADDAGDGGPKPPAGQPYKYCVPNSGFSCPCNDKRDGVERNCEKKNDQGRCTGTEACSAQTGKFEGCTAKTPTAEACNAEDDNCDGTIDEGDQNAMCTAEGGALPHASWACAAGQCGLGPCEPGWANYPPGAVKDGCACPMEAGEPNDLCANATPGGTVTDMPGSNVTLSGTLSSATDVDVWVIDTSDTDELTTNSYHVSIDFAAPMPNDEFLMDIVRGDACTDAPSGNASGITSYDWCVDGKSADGLEGEGQCANDGSLPVHCNDNSSKYFVRVRRKLGASGTCNTYSIVVTGRGGDPCDFTQKCQ